MAVILISMPFATPHHPNLGISLLKGALLKEGVKCDVKYFSLMYADFCGLPLYSFLQDDRFFSLFLGEWIFRSCVFPDDPKADLEYLSSISKNEQLGDRINAKRIQQLLHARMQASAFLERCLVAVDWQQYQIVGFTTSFQQTLPSIALAQRLKELFPHLTIAFGGANCEGEMGIELSRQFPFLDYVFSGEADLTFPTLVNTVLNGQPVEQLPGVIHRDGGSVLVPNQLTAPVQNLDDLPYPVFDDFFDQHNQYPTIKEAYRPVLLIETARGCWWGQKQHCTFCGLNGSTMAYRSKSQVRAFEEIRELTERYTREVLIVDNILDMRYFDNFLPSLAQLSPPVVMHYEVKVNLRPWQIQSLAEAGVRKIQPGIESLDSTILKLMRKGCSLLQNVQTLRLSAEFGIHVEWGHLYGFPGELPEAYLRIEQVIPLLEHLQPPAGITQVRADRFSPYFAKPEEYAIDVRPLVSYGFIWPVDPESLRRLAYHFEIHVQNGTDPKNYVGGLFSCLRKWAAGYRSGLLLSVDDGDNIRVLDERSCRVASTHCLEGNDAGVLRECDEIRSLAWLSERLGTCEGKLGESVLRLVSKKLLLMENDRYLALPVRTQPARYSRPEIRHKATQNVQLPIEI
ncbi:MAG: RiPP maturation radical SAM C-methyltransferase [Pirellula sp.]